MKAKSLIPMLISSHVYSTFTHTHGLGFSLIHVIVTVEWLLLKPQCINKHFRSVVIAQTYPTILKHLSIAKLKCLWLFLMHTYLCKVKCVQAHTHIHTHTYTYIHTYPCMHILTHPHAHIHTHKHTHPCMHILTHTPTCTHTCTHTPMHVYTHTRTRIETHRDTDTLTRAHTLTHACAHTHTHKLSVCTELQGHVSVCNICMCMYM